MAKDWHLVRSEITTLYIAKGKSLDDVRRILKGRHQFDASIRAYRMKLEEWGVRKNNVTAKTGTQARSRQPLKTTHRGHSSREARSTSRVSAVQTNDAASTQITDSILQFQEEAWSPALQLSSNYGSNGSNIAASSSFRGNSLASYNDPAEQINFSSQDQRLHIAISQGTEEDVTNLLSSGVSVNTRNSLNNSPLHTAILKGNISIVRSLLNYGANVDAIGFHGNTPLHLAAVSREMEIFRALLRHQPRLSLQDYEGNTILHHILLKNWLDNPEDTAIIKRLLSYGSDINIINKSGESALHRIVADAVPGSEEYMKMMYDFLHNRPDVQSPMRNGLSLFAVFLENSKLLDELGYSKAIAKGFECLEQFLVAGADPNTMFRSKPLVNYCLEHAYDVMRWDGHDFMVTLLQKANIERPSSVGDSLLHLVLKKSYDKFNAQFVSTLISRKLDVNQKDSTGASPLELYLGKFWGQSRLRTEVVELLIKAGASTTVVTSKGKSLFDLLHVYQRPDLIKLLLEADIDSKQEDGDNTMVQDWTKTWRLAWQQSIWRSAKAHLIELEQTESRSKGIAFCDCAFLIIAERLLKGHKTRLVLWQTGSIHSENVKEDYEEYCAILRDCRERKAAIDVSWYKFLLDIMDFK